METQSIINTNSIAFIGLCNEYCTTLENAAELTRQDFLDRMLGLLPRIYIAATDLKVNMVETEEPYLESSLEEDYYESIRSTVASLIGADDVYLEVFEEDMKYSDTPVSASISEGLSDIFQVAYNFLTMVKDAPDEIVGMGLLAVRYDFREYWGATLCNVLRALHNLRYSFTFED